MRNDERNARQSPLSAFGTRIGNRWKFAVEFDAIQDFPDAWNKWWGSLWFWVDGCPVGAPQETEMVLIGLDSLYEAAGEDRIRASGMISSLTSKEALDAVMQARYGRDSDSTSNVAVPEEELVALEILPRRTGPFFEGWEAILLDDGESERFIYRKEQEEKVLRTVWPKGTFRTVVQQARNEFERLARFSLNGKSGACR